MNYYQHLLFALVLCTLHEIKSSDVSERHRDVKFRTGQVQQLWRKAEGMQISSTMLDNLYDEMKHHDHRLMEIKEIKQKGGDVESLMEGELQRSIDDTIARFNLTRRNPDNLSANLEKKNEIRFEDDRLHAIWEEISNSKKLSPDDFDRILLDFQYQQDKLVELNFLQQSIDAHENVAENSLLRHDQELLQKHHEESEELREAVETGYKRFKWIARVLRDDNFNPFVDLQIAELWKQVEDRNLNEEEKETLKEEFKDFDRKREKQRHFKEKLQNSFEKLDFHYGGEKEVPKEDLQKHEKLLDKVKDLNSQVQNFLANWKARLGDVIKHKEL